MRTTDGVNCSYVSGVQILRPKKKETGTQTHNEDANWNKWDAEEQEEISHMIKDEYRQLNLEHVRPQFSTGTWIEEDKEHAHYDTVVRCFVKRNSCPMELSARVDKASRVLFPLSFLLYNIAYWVTYYYGITILPYRIWYYWTISITTLQFIATSSAYALFVPVPGRQRWEEPLR